MSNELVQIRRPDLSNSVWYMGHLVSILTRSSDTGGVLGLVYVRGRRGFEPPAHVHSLDSSLNVSLDGFLHVTINGKEGKLDRGGISIAPRWSEQTFRATEPEFEALLAFSPAGMEDYFSYLGQVAEELTVPPLRDLTSVFERVPEANRLQGITFTGLDRPHPSPADNSGSGFWANPTASPSPSGVQKLAGLENSGGVWEIEVYDLGPNQSLEVQAEAGCIRAVYPLSGAFAAGSSAARVEKPSLLCLSGGENALVTSVPGAATRLLSIIAHG